MLPNLNQIWDCDRETESMTHTILGGGGSSSQKSVHLTVNVQRQFLGVFPLKPFVSRLCSIWLEKKLGFKYYRKQPVIGQAQVSSSWLSPLQAWLRVNFFLKNKIVELHFSTTVQRSRAQLIFFKKLNLSAFVLSGRYFYRLCFFAPWFLKGST